MAVFRTLQRLRVADLIDLQRLTEAWETYDLEWTSDGVAPVIGNGVLTGKKLTVGKTVYNYIDAAMGSTTTFGSGTYFFSLSQTAKSGQLPIGAMYMADFSAGTNKSGILAGFGSPSTDVIGVSSADTTIAATVPHTWAVSDRLAGIVMFEVT